MSARQQGKRAAFAHRPRWARISEDSLLRLEVVGEPEPRFMRGELFMLRSKPRAPVRRGGGRARR